MTTPGGAEYSAGSIALQVVPSFRGFQRAVQQEAENLDRAMGEELGKGDGIEKGVGDALTRATKKHGAKQGDALGQEMGKAVTKRLDALLRNLTPVLNLRTEGAAKVQGELDKILRSALKLRDNIALGVDVRGARDAAEQVDDLAVRAIALDGKEIDLRARAHFAATHTELRRLEGAVRALDGKSINIDERGLDNFVTRAQGAGNALRGFNAAVLAGAAAGPALVPILGALAAGLLAVGSAASGIAAGGGVLALGLSGIGEGVKALTKAQEDGAKQARTLGKSQRAAANAVLSAERSVTSAREGAARSAENAAERVGDAQRGVVRAQEQSARGVRNALRGVERAEESLADAQKDAARAQRDLQEARKEAKGDLADLDTRIREGAVAERQALVDLFEAQVAYNALQADGGATNLEQEQASIALEEARIAILRQRQENKALAEEQAKAATTGVEGTEKVQAAQERATEATERVTDAQRSLGDAQENVSIARADGALAVADAERNLAQAQEDQRDVAVSGQQAIADAQRGLRDAQLSYNDALLETTTAADDLALAMGKLSPSGQRFAEFIFGLRDEFFLLRSAAQEGMLPGFQTAITNLLPFMPQIIGFVSKMAEVIGGLAIEASEGLTSGPFVAFFGMLNDLGPTFVEQFAAIMGNLFTIFAQLSTAFAPLAVKIGGALVSMTDGFVKFLDSERGQKMLGDFMAYAERVGPKVAAFVEAFADALLNLMIGLAPYGEMFLGVLTGFLNFLSDIPPEVLGAIVFSLITMVFAFQVLAGLVGGIGAVLGVVSALMAIFATSAAVVVGTAAVILGLAIVFGIAYAKSETFRDIVNGVFRSVGDMVMWFWNKVVKPTFQFIVDYLQFVWTVWSAVFELMFAIIGKVGEKFAEFYTKYIKPYTDAIGKYLREMLSPVWEYIRDSAIGTWEDIKTLFAKGIDFVVNTVINKGLIDNFNKLADFFDTSKIPNVPLSRDISNQAKKPLGQNKVEYAEGGWTGPGSKWQPAGVVHADEFVIQKSSQRKLARRFPGLLDYLNATGTLPGYDVGGFVKSKAGGLWDGIKQGAGAVKSGAASIVDMLSDPAEFLLAKIKGLLTNVGESPLGKLLTAVPTKLVGFAVDKIKGAFSVGAVAGQSGPRSVAGDGELASNAVLAKKIVMSTLGFKGTIGGWGRRPNKTEHDDMIGGKKASRALDFMTTDLATGNAIVNLLDMMPYTDYLIWQRRIKSRGKDWRPYGGRSPHTDHVHWSGYADGGLVKPTLYDTGGYLPPGLSTIMNATGKPELIFTEQQFQEIAGSRGDTYYQANVSVPPSNVTPGAVASEMLFAMRRIQRGGVYAGAR